MSDQQLLERRVRETLQTRADGVTARPALYERVQRGVRRRRWWARGRAVASLAVVAGLAGTVITALPATPRVDVLEVPGGEVADLTNGDSGPDGPASSPRGGVGHAAAYEDGTLTIVGPEDDTYAQVTDDSVVADLAVPVGWQQRSGVLAALVERTDGTRSLQLYARTDQEWRTADVVADVEPDGDAVTVLPDGSGVLWVDDGFLAGRSIRSGVDGPVLEPLWTTALDLPSDGPESLVAQQVVPGRVAGAPEGALGELLLLATDPVGRDAWAIPLQENGERYDPAFVAEPIEGLGDVLDLVSLPDARLLTLEASVDGGAPFLRLVDLRTRDEQVHPLGGVSWPNDAGLELESGGGDQVVLVDRDLRRSIRLRVTEDETTPFEQLGGQAMVIADVPVGADPSAWSQDGAVPGDATEPDAVLRDGELVAGSWPQVASFVRGSAAAGEATVVHVVAPWCGPCERHLAAADSVADRPGVRTLVVVVSSDRADAQQFLDAQERSRPSLLDRTGSTRTALAASGIPATALFDGDGVLRSVTVGVLETARLEDELDRLLAE